MSASALFGARAVSLPNPSSVIFGGGAATKAFPGGGGTAAAVIECSSRPQKKATAHHIKTRPKKTQPWDIKRRPTVYPPRPPLPPDWTLVTPASTEAAAAASSEPAGDGSSSPPLEPTMNR